ncbi:murein hydrolase activator EnvC family protein [Larsenimonas rhizosphaerae]|uniref:murein hydrolase activator EnvC family protein n=1 Tax=Larsenimonas rhizosphaerae TaxID=2944682 RepID=UPI002033D127|nr:peptidoglycan DD-metalloendopeptidase family protein [Larsenimonas rhizosphaerae]MCM2129338.1 peptidoglycan DD-metalloendopeptidase family protein [Larsenimonas rhizosphaerae]
MIVTCLRRRGSLLVLALLIMTPGLAPGVLAADISKAQLERIGATVEAAENRLDATSSKRRKARQALEKAERQLAATHKRLDDLADRQREIESSLRTLNTQRASLEQERSDQREGLARQLAGLYRLGRDPRMKLLLNQQDPAQAARFQHYLNALNKARQARLDALASLNLDLARNEHQLNEQQASLDTTRATLTRQQATLDSQRREREQAVATLNAEYGSRQSRLAALKREQTQAEKTFNAMQEQLARARKTTGTGELTAEEASAEAPAQPSRVVRAGKATTGKWPIAGARMLSAYGKGEGVHRNGVLLGARAGTTVRAMVAGQVVFANWMRGFGYLVIVADRNNVLTLYAHNQRINVTTGDQVEKGAALATVGDSGGLSQPALYFEVRSKGNPVDPGRWLSRH